MTQRFALVVCFLSILFASTASAQNWSFDARKVGLGRGFQGKSFHGGGEYRLGAIDVRGGAVYSREMWNPAAGVGFNMSPGTSMDVALYANSSNVERKRHPAIAVSLRFNR